MQKKNAKCPRCCPDQPYAIFEATIAIDMGSDSDRMRPIWRCLNCHQELPRRVNSSEATKPTASQQAWLDRIASGFGGTIETQFMGRKLWVSANNTDRKWYSGERLYGTIGPKGQIKLELSCMGGKKITDDISFRAWVEETK